MAFKGGVLCKIQGLRLSIEIIRVMENPMDSNMENGMEAGSLRGRRPVQSEVGDGNILPQLCREC